MPFWDGCFLPLLFWGEAHTAAFPHNPPQVCKFLMSTYYLWDLVLGLLSEKWDLFSLKESISKIRGCGERQGTWTTITHKTLLAGRTEPFSCLTTCLKTKQKWKTMLFQQMSLKWKWTWYKNFFIDHSNWILCFSKLFFLKTSTFTSIFGGIFRRLWSFHETM